MFVFDVKGHYRSSVSLKFIFCPNSLWDKLAIRISVCTWWNNTNAITSWDWAQLWQMGMEAASPHPSRLRTSCCDVRSNVIWWGPSCAAPTPLPEQGRTRFCLILSFVSFPWCLKIQGEQRCKLTAVFVFILYLGSRRASLLCLLPALVHQLQLEPGLWVDTSLLRFRLSFPSHFVELARDNKHWALISYPFMQQSGAMGLCCRTIYQHITHIGSKQLLSTVGRDIWDINQYGKSLKPLRTQFTILCK